MLATRSLNGLTVSLAVFVVTDGAGARKVTISRREAEAFARTANALLPPDALPYTVEEGSADVSWPADRAPKRFG